MKSLYKSMILLGLIVSLASLYFQSTSITLGVIAGVIIAIINLWLIQRSVGGLLAGQRTKLTGLYAAKIVALLVILFVLIKVAGLDPIGILAGLSVLVVVSMTGGPAMMQAADEETTSVEGDG